MRIMRGFNGTVNFDGGDIDIIIETIKDISPIELKVDYEKLKQEMTISKNNYKQKYKPNNKVNKNGKHNG